MTTDVQVENTPAIKINALLAQFFAALPFVIDFEIESQSAKQIKKVYKGKITIEKTFSQSYQTKSSKERT